MSGQIFDAMGIPVGGRQPTREEIQAVQQQEAFKLRMSAYLSLLPVVAARLLDRQTQEDDFLHHDDRPTETRIAEEADRITRAALRVFPGITFDG
jgi:hypothetical protein